MQRDEETQAGEERDHDEPGIVVNQALQGRREQTDAGDQGRQGQLNREETVDLAQKT